MGWVDTACIEAQASQSLSENTFLVLFLTFEEAKTLSYFYFIITVRWSRSQQSDQSYPIQSIPSLRFECSIPDLINYVMLLSSFPFFKSFQSAINSHLCSLYHSDIPPSLLMVLLYLVIGKKNPVINSTHRHKSDKEMIIQILRDRHLNDNMRMQTQMIHLVKFLKKWSP